MSGIYMALNSYMAFKRKPKLNRMLINLQKILPDTNVRIRLMNIVKRECDGKHFNAENFATASLNIYRMLINELNDIVKKHQISDREISIIESIIDEKLKHS